MDKKAEGTVVSVSRQWWLRMGRKAVRTGLPDAASFPHIVKVKYEAYGREYTKRKWFNAGVPVPEVGSTVQVLFDTDRPSKAKIV